MNLEGDAGQPYQPSPEPQQRTPPGRKKRGQQHDQAGAPTCVTRREGVAVKPGVESESSSWWAPAVEDPFEGGGDRTSDQRSGHHTPSQIVPGSVSPEEGRRCTKQPQWAVATVSCDERQQAGQARIFPDDEARRQFIVESEEAV